ncbi:MAG TPA: hypothetical protein VD707_00900 [Gemmatimonadales bacterium]|jgi:uncharacterized protein YbaR (Trm112 family)|nr:hypothetical protein [Gemmatimonadales bacterium]
MHIELTEMLRCPESHQESFLVLSTGEMSGRMVRHGLVGCPVCHREYRILEGIVDFGGAGTGDAGRGVTDATRPPSPVPRPDVLQALLDLSGPGGYVVLLGAAARAGPALASLVGGIHCIGVNAPDDLAEEPRLSLLRCGSTIPLRGSMARGVVVGADLAEPPWLAEAARVLLRGRRLVVTGEDVAAPGVKHLVTGEGLWVGEKQ